MTNTRTIEVPAFHALVVALAIGFFCQVVPVAANAQDFFNCNASDGDPQAFNYRVLRKYPHRRQAFTQGLLFHRGFLYESTGRKGYSSIARIELPGGKVLQERDLAPEYFGEGLAVAGEQLVQLSWRAGKVFRYQLDDFTPAGVHTIEGEGWGITHDGKSLVTSNGSDRLTWRDEQTLQPIKTLAVSFRGRPLAGLNELEWSNGCVLANVWPGTTLVAIDASNGQVSHMLDLARLLEYEKRLGEVDVANGIAIYPADSNGEASDPHLLVTGKHWRFIYEILPLQATGQ